MNELLPNVLVSAVELLDFLLQQCSKLERLVAAFNDIITFNTSSGVGSVFLGAGE